MKTVDSKMRKKQANFLSEEYSIQGLSAKDTMIKPVFLYPDDTTKTIMKKLKKEHINSCIVVTEDKKLLGQISEKDILDLFLQQVKYEPVVQILNRGYRREFLYKTAKDLINDNKFFVRLNTPINKVIELVWKEGYEYISVLDKEDTVVGVITPSSIINLLKDY